MSRKPRAEGIGSKPYIRYPRSAVLLGPQDSFPSGIYHTPACGASPSGLVRRGDDQVQFTVPRTTSSLPPTSQPAVSQSSYRIPITKSLKAIEDSRNPRIGECPKTPLFVP
ncbi:hypothetical protein E2C01_094767 [Portunus trituberculatus]|uniref:Uncharacterized protein n=1 Tax=Portunus trituberculatus TaxID=210409 RepID=A0A5B7K2J7_PORTR|nr:hypothetical protein [Portunus trituberculatus]